MTGQPESQADREGAPWAYIISATLPQISPYLNSFQKTLFQNNFPWCRIAIMNRISTGNHNRSNALTKLPASNFLNRLS